MVAPVIAAGLGAAGRAGYRFAPSLMNLGRRLFSPGPWKRPEMVTKARGLAKFQSTSILPLHEIWQVPAFLRDLIPLPPQ